VAWQCAVAEFHPRVVSTEAEILAAVDAMPDRRKARLTPKLRRRLEDYYDLQAVRRAQAKGVHRAYVPNTAPNRLRDLWPMSWNANPRWFLKERPPLFRFMGLNPHADGFESRTLSFSFLQSREHGATAYPRIAR
jgi:hypothetical protein